MSEFNGTNHNVGDDAFNYDEFLSVVQRDSQLKAQAVSDKIMNFGEQPRFFTGIIDAAPVAILWKKHSPKIARLIFNMEQPCGLFIEDHIFVARDNRGIRRQSYAPLKTSEEKLSDLLLLEQRLREHNEKLENGKESELQLVPGTVWSTKNSRGPIIASDTNAGIVVVNRSSRYEQQAAEDLKNRRMRNEGHLEDILTLLQRAPIDLIEITPNVLIEGNTL